MANYELEQRWVMRKEEFLHRYAARSNLSLTTLAEHNFYVCSCDCGAPNCRGWAMLTVHEIEAKKEVGVPLPNEVYLVRDMLDDCDGNIEQRSERK